MYIKLTTKLTNQLGLKNRIGKAQGKKIASSDSFRLIASLIVLKEILI